MRIVSLLPAATEIVYALGLGEHLVGRSHECDFPPAVTALPALTRARVDSSLPSAELDAQVRATLEQRLPLYELDEARLTALRPDVVVTQEACEVCAVSYDQVVGALRRTPVHAQVVSLKPAFLGDVLRDMRTVADACEIGDRGRRVVGELDARLEAARQRVPRATRPRVALVEWLAPPMLAGHWTPEIVEAAGGVPVGPESGSPSPYATWEEIRAHRPDVVVVAPCGMDLERTRLEARPQADTLHTLAPRVFLLDGNAYLNRPGPRLVDAVEILQAWLLGESVPAHIGCAL